jgi:glycerol-3-phosphate O-acyltransferase
MLSQVGTKGSARRVSRASKAGLPDTAPRTSSGSLTRRVGAREPGSQRATVVQGLALIPEVERRVVTQVLSRCERVGQRLDEVIYETLYREEQRLARASNAPRAAEDRRFLTWLGREVRHTEASRVPELIHAVVAHYAEEIAGVFDPRVYRFATRLLPPALGALMHQGLPRRENLAVNDRLLIGGHVDELRALAELGTVMLAPTHVSHLDSLLLGYAIYALDLPPFAYGAGLNLFSQALTGFFMRNLGAFTVDRKKSDPLYRATLREYTVQLLEHGQPLLFFPGGTRSRAGALESHLKLGLLGTAIRAFGRSARRPIFVVPCTLSYPLVLEAESLMVEFLRTEGGPQYVEARDEYARPAAWFDFLRGLSQVELQVHVRFGQPLDVLGNPVDVEGISRDPRGQALDPARYLQVDGTFVEDEARDAEYTRMLGDRLVGAYRRESVALPSSLLAFVLFEHARQRYPQLDLFRLLRMTHQLEVPLTALRHDLEHALEALRALAARGELALAPELQTASPDALITRGTATLSTYHRVPVLVRQEESLKVQNPALLFYYRNRLDGFGLLESACLKQLFARKRRRRWA